MVDRENDGLPVFVAWPAESQVTSAVDDVLSFGLNRREAMGRIILIGGNPGPHGSPESCAAVHAIGRAGVDFGASFVDGAVLWFENDRVAACSGVESI